MLLFSCSKVFCRYIYDTIGIDIKGNLDLRYSTHCRWNAIQTELSKRFIVAGELSFTLYYVDVYCGLIIGCGREDLALLRRNCCISFDQFGSYTAHCLDSKRKWGNIQKKDIAGTGISGKFTTLNGSTQCYTLIRVQRFIWLMSCQLFYFVLYGRDTCGTTNQKNFAKFRSSNSGIFQCIVYRSGSSLYQICCQFIEFCTCQVHIKMFWSFLCCCDKWKVDICRCCGRKLFLCFLSSFFQTLHCHLITGKVDAFCFLKFAYHVIAELVIEVVTTKTVISGC